MLYKPQMIRSSRRAALALALTWILAQPAEAQHVGGIDGVPVTLGDTCTGNQGSPIVCDATNSFTLGTVPVDCHSAEMTYEAAGQTLSSTGTPQVDFDTCVSATAGLCDVANSELDIQQTGIYRAFTAIMVRNQMDSGEGLAVVLNLDPIAGGPDEFLETKGQTSGSANASVLTASAYWQGPLTAGDSISVIVSNDHAPSVTTADAVAGDRPALYLEQIDCGLGAGSGGTDAVVWDATSSAEAADVITVSLQVDDSGGSPYSGTFGSFIQLRDGTGAIVTASAYTITDGGLGSVSVGSGTAWALVATDTAGLVELDITDVVGASSGTVSLEIYGGFNAVADSHPVGSFVQIVFDGS